MNASVLTPEQASALVSIVVVPRERFSVALVSLDSLLKETAPGYQLIYVDAGSPPAVRDGLRQRARDRGFTLLRDERFLAPNIARNLGAARAERKYVLFLDNDTLVTPDWLTQLVRCAEETGAGLVGPLYMVGPFEMARVHMQGGLWKVEHKDGQGWPSDDYVMTEKNLNEIRDQLHRREVDFIEFHCMLVRADLLRRVGPFDEQLLSSPEHIDFSLRCRREGALILSEPAAMITYLRAFDMELYDLAYFLVRWSPQWNRQSLKAFAGNWNYSAQSEFVTWQSRWLDENGARYGLIKVPEPIGQRIVPASSRAVAQTNMALFAAMAAEGYGGKDIAAVSDTYGLAQAMFGHLYRNSGKPFLAHAIGTAAVLAAYRQPADLLRAAILHAAFSHARYPTGIDQAARPAWLQARCGEDVARLVAHYHRWQAAAGPPATAEAIWALPAWDGAAIAIAMANVVDDAVDGANAFGALNHPARQSWLACYDLVGNLIRLPGLARSARLALTAPAPDWTEKITPRAPISYVVDRDEGRAVPFDRASAD